MLTYVVVGVVVFGALLVLLWVLYMVRGKMRHARLLKAKVGPPLDALRRGERVAPEEIRRAAGDPHTRLPLYECLRELEKVDLFPASYRSREAFAEAELVRWLCYPTELGCPPDEIELMDTVRIDSGSSLGEVDYYLFRYCTHEPHWAASDGWMAGVAGPYAVGEPEYLTEVYRATFSRFEAYASKTSRQHVAHCHELASRKGMYGELSAKLEARPD